MDIIDLETQNPDLVEIEKLFFKRQQKNLMSYITEYQTIIHFTQIHCL